MHRVAFVREDEYSGGGSEEESETEAEGGNEAAGKRYFRTQRQHMQATVTVIVRRSVGPSIRSFVVRRSSSIRQPSAVG